MSLKSQLESLLFVSLKPLSLKELVKFSQAKVDDVKQALEELTNDYRVDNRGLTIIKNEQKYQLTTASDNAELVKKFLQDETNGELSQAKLETLTIIAYRGPISKLELDRIRGINCSLIIRNLLLRGLIEEKFSQTKKENYYQVSHDFIRFLGLNSVSDLPDYEKLHQAESIDSVLIRGEEQVEIIKDKEE